MKQIGNMSQVELAAFVQSHLKESGIDVILSGGSAVSFYSSNKYVSKDLDLINASFSKRSKIKSVMEALGFQEQGRYFVNSETQFFVGFPVGRFLLGKNL